MRVCRGTRGTKANVRLRATTLWRGRKTWQEEGDREKGQVRGRKEKRKGGGGEKAKRAGHRWASAPFVSRELRKLHAFSPSLLRSLLRFFSPPPRPRAIRNVPYEIEITRW